MALSMKPLKTLGDEQVHVVLVMREESLDWLWRAANGDPLAASVMEVMTTFGKTLKTLPKPLGCLKCETPVPADPGAIVMLIPMDLSEPRPCPTFVLCDACTGTADLGSVTALVRKTYDVRPIHAGTEAQQ